MSGERYSVARLDEIAHSRGGALTPVRAHFGIQAFGVNAWRGDAGSTVISDHDEGSSGEQELYFVLTGRATFTVAGENLDAPAGTFVYVGEPATQRTAVAAEPDTTVIALGGKRGEAYRPLGWEWSEEAYPFFGEGRYAEAYELLGRVDEQHPDTPIVLYNLACAAARIGKTDEAVEHLRRAIELYDGFAAMARDDPDLEPVRDHPSLSLA